MDRRATTNMERSKRLSVLQAPRIGVTDRVIESGSPSLDRLGRSQARFPIQRSARQHTTDRANFTSAIEVEWPRPVPPTHRLALLDNAFGAFRSTPSPPEDGKLIRRTRGLSNRRG